LDLTGSQCSPMAGSCNSCNEQSGSVKDGTFQRQILNRGAACLVNRFLHQNSLIVTVSAPGSQSQFKSLTLSAEPYSKSVL
jgi:hypothetical protein